MNSLRPTAACTIQMLSENQCEGWLEGYLLTGRHGLFNSYEAFIRIIDSMFSQHAKWQGDRRTAMAPAHFVAQLFCSPRTSGSRIINGFTHQDPGFLDHVVNQKGVDRTRVFAARRQLPAFGL